MQSYHQPSRVAGIALALALAMFVNAEENVKKTIDADIDVTVGKRPGVTESVTVTRQADGSDTVTMSKEIVSEAAVRKPRVNVPADTARRSPRLVVLPATYQAENRNVFIRELKEKYGFDDPAAVENPGYSAFLTDALVNARAFDLLEREQIATTVKELDFGESDYADAAKVVRLGGMLNADYVVIPEIRYFGLLTLVKDVPYIQMKTQSMRSELSVSVRVVEVKTSKIAASMMEKACVTNAVRRAETSPGNPVRNTIDDTYRASAQQVTQRILASGIVPDNE